MCSIIYGLLSKRVKKDIKQTTLRIEELEKVVAKSELEKMVEEVV